MAKKILISLIIIITIANQHLNAQEKYVDVISVTPDTLDEETEIIDDIINNKSSHRKEKVQYFSQITKYGFKNLFNNYSYTSTAPYTTQINSNATGFIEAYMKQHGKYLLNMKSWGQPYFNLIENILTQYGLPKELKYIAVIESNLKTSAVSCKGAGGPWQFMPATARQFNLVINNYTDERTDYFKSTHAAAKYLLYLYKDLKDWLLVMAAYNGGPGRVFNAIRKSGSKDFWNLQYYLPEESRTYVKRFIATHYIMEGGMGLDNFANTGTMNYESLNSVNTSATQNNFNTTYVDLYEVNKPRLNEQEANNVETYNISGKFNSTVIAKNLALNIAEFNHYNPGFDAMLNNIGSYDLRLPADKMQLFLANKYQILNECVQLILNSDEINFKPQSHYYTLKKHIKKKKR